MKFTWLYPAKTNLQDHARNLACKTCLARARDMCIFLHDSCTILHQFLQDLAKKCARNSKLAGNYSCSKILHHFLQDMCKILQDMCKIVQESCKKRDISRGKSCMPDSCTILHDLASSFLLGNKQFESGTAILCCDNSHTHFCTSPSWSYS